MWRCLRAGLFVLCGLLVVGIGSTQIAANESDKLVLTAYRYGGGTSLVLYDPNTHESRIIYESEGWRLPFQLSTTGQIVYSTEWRGNSSIFLLDIHAPGQAPVNLSQIIDLMGYSLEWSPDGKLLAFAVFSDEEELLIYVWDGEEAINITPNDMLGAAQSYDVTWSQDGRLAIKVSFSSPSNDLRPETYLWDSETTFNFSQNPDGEDHLPAWNPDGELAGLYDRNGYNIFIWDGVSFEADHFTFLPRELIGYYSFPSWTPDGKIVFRSQSTEDTHVQAYVWDGETATNITQNPDFHNTTPRWSLNGYWTFWTFFSSEQLLYVRDVENRTLLTTEGHSGAWSSQDELIFCNYGENGWVLSLWDRQAITKIIQADEIWAQWQSGQGTICSSG